MSLRFYHRFKAWRRGRLGHPATRPERAAVPPREAGDNPAIYAAGIACAGQVSEAAAR
ncbi:MAG: hypothetical protein PHS77_09300 [Gallionellaceae bacterium]|nr:hypothetical protein [Gallionellaceae bacterium]